MTFTMTADTDVLTAIRSGNEEMPLRKNLMSQVCAATSTQQKGVVEVARAPNKEVALIRHIAKLEDKHRARVKILNSIEENRLSNTLKQMDFAKVTVGHSIEKQARSFERSLVTIKQRQTQINKERYHFDHRKLKPPPGPLYYDDIDDLDDDLVRGGGGRLPFQMTAPSRSTGGLSLPHGPFSYKDRRREPLGRWIRYPPSFRKGTSQMSQRRGLGGGGGACLHSARFSPHHTPHYLE